MATRKNEPPPPPESSPKNALIILTVGCLVVAGLVVWALTRTVEPAATPAAVPTASAPIDTTTRAPFNPTDTALTPLSTQSPVQVQIEGGAPQAVPQSNQPFNPPTASPGRTEDQIKRIAAEDVRDRVNAGQAVVVDVRDAAQFAQGHIPGAVNMPFASVQTMMSSLPKDKEIITYCT